MSFLQMLDGTLNLSVILNNNYNKIEEDFARIILYNNIS